MNNNVFYPGFSMYEDFLQRLGLSQNEALIYNILLTRGKSEARDIVEQSGLGRGNVYNLLASLLQKKVIFMTEGKKQIYSVAHPERLLALLEERRHDIDRIAQEAKELMPKFISHMQIATGKPVLRFFEGLTGLEEAIEDSLTADERGICTFLDVTAFRGEIAEANTRYVKKRLAKGVAKKILVADTPEARSFFGPIAMPSTEVRYLEEYPQGIAAVTEIYNDTIAFFTLHETSSLAALMTDTTIATMQRAQFMYLWKLARRQA